MPFEADFCHFKIILYEVLYYISKRQINRKKKVLESLGYVILIYFLILTKIRKDLIFVLFRRMSMFLILPDTVEPGIATLESTITTHFVKELRATLKVWIIIHVCLACCYSQPLFLFVFY